MRQCASRPDLAITSEGMPQDWEYADDVDFADEEHEPLDSLLQTACTQLRVWNHREYRISMLEPPSE